MILKGCRSQTIEIGGKTIGLSGATFERPKQPRCAKTGRFKAVAKRHPIIIGNPTTLSKEKPDDDMPPGSGSVRSDGLWKHPTEL